MQPELTQEQQEALDQNHGFVQGTSYVLMSIGRIPVLRHWFPRVLVFQTALALSGSDFMLIGCGLHFQSVRLWLRWSFRISLTRSSQRSLMT